MTIQHGTLSAQRWSGAGSFDLLGAASRYYGSAQCLPVAGSQAAIALLPQMRLPCRVGVLRDSYAEHAWQWQRHGHSVCLLLPEEVDAAVDGLDVLILVNPNNPTGQLWPRSQLMAWRERLAARDGWLIVDEAFADLDPQHSLCADAGEVGLIVLRSLGKFFALAGVRLGFVFAEHSLRATMARLLGPWSVSGPAVWAGALALNDSWWQVEQYERILADAAWLNAALRECGLVPVGTHPLMQYCLVDSAKLWGYALAKQKIYCRQFNTQGFNTHGVNALRFGPVPVQQRDEFLRRLRAAVQQLARNHMQQGPQRIACLSSETVEVLYALGQEHRIAGISAFARHPEGVSKNHPIICGFSSAKVEKIFAVEPDLILAYSSLQGDIVKECILAGFEVHFFNQKSIAGIFDMIANLGRMLDCNDRADALISDLLTQIRAAQDEAATYASRPKVYFEEWHTPLYSGIRWVSELIAIAGGEDVFASLSHATRAKDRTVTPEQVIAAAPDLIIGSWCGQDFEPGTVSARAGWQAIPAVKNQQLFAVASEDLLVPGITAITRGLPLLQSHIRSLAQ